MIILSPAKNLRPNPSKTKKHSAIRFAHEAEVLNGILAKQSQADLQALQKVSQNIAETNVLRNRSFSLPFEPKDTPTAIHSFFGDAFRAMDIEDWTGHDHNYAQKNLRILSGLYGLLRPMDLMHPYRLEMGTTLANPAGSNLYKFWDDKITNLLNHDLAEGSHKYLINLASKEYWEAVDSSLIEVPIYTIHFREWKNEKWSFISYNAKRARGLMSKYILLNRVKSLRSIKAFNVEGYSFNAELSNKTDWFFTR